jgi:hypothetical protein
MPDNGGTGTSNDSENVTDGKTLYVMLHTE